MIILIDGYNLLRQIFPKEKGQLNRQRKQLVKELGFYRLKKKEQITEIILVFDAGPFHRALREIKNGIVVMYSGQKSSADEWIVNYIKTRHYHEILLITLDRELIDSCKKANVQQMDVMQFYKIIKDSLYEELEQDITKTIPTQKLENNYINADIESFEEIASEIDSQALDILMEESAITHTNTKIDDDNKPKKKKGSANKISKKKKRVYATLKKLK